VNWFITTDTRIIDPLPAPITEVKPGVENATLNRAVSTPGQDNHPFFKKPATPGERLFAPKRNQQHDAHCLMPYSGHCLRCSYRMAWIVIRGKGSSSDNIRKASHT
jgi:hypothetical protein